MVRRPAGAGQGLGLPYPGGGEEDPRQLLVLVLAGVQQPPGCVQAAGQRRELDYFWASPNDNGNVTRIGAM
jgi:hypothetical protein